MTTQIPAFAPFIDSFRDAAVAKMQSMYSGQIPDSVAAEVALAALITAWPAIGQHIREQIAREIESDFTAPPWHLAPKPRIGSGGQWIDSRDCTKAAAIARGEL